MVSELRVRNQIRRNRFFLVRYFRNSMRSTLVGLLLREIELSVRLSSKMSGNLLGGFDEILYEVDLGVRVKKCAVKVQCESVLIGKEP